MFTKRYVYVKHERYVMCLFYFSGARAQIKAQKQIKTDKKKAVKNDIAYVSIAVLAEKDWRGQCSFSQIV